MELAIAITAVVVQVAGWAAIIWQARRWRKAAEAIASKHSLYMLKPPDPPDLPSIKIDRFGPDSVLGYPISWVDSRDDDDPSLSILP